MRVGLALLNHPKVFCTATAALDWASGDGGAWTLCVPVDQSAIFFLDFRVALALRLHSQKRCSPLRRQLIQGRQGGGRLLMAPVGPVHSLQCRWVLLVYKERC